MNVLSLFSGVGGFDLGLENAGMKTIYQCEWDKHATRILERHWPQVPRWGDITTLTGKEILSHGTPPDVVAWGSPCQDLSVAGKRAGLEGERSGLFHEGIRIINEIRKETNNEYPRISIWENVAGALSSNRGADFGVILDEMAKAGAMVIEWGLLDAQHFGIPQRRRRVFVIAIFNPATATNCPSPLLPVGESLPRDSKKGKPKRKSAASETSESVGAGSRGEQFLTEESYAESSFAQFKEGDVAALKASGGVLGGGSETLIVGALTVSDLTRQVTNEIVSKNLLQVVEPYVKSRRAQSATDDETWVPGEVNPTLNSFDVGDTRATTAIVEPYEMVNRPVKDPVGTLQARVAATNHESIRDGHAIVEELMLVDGTRVDDVRVYEPPVQTLGARMGTGGNNVPNVLQYDGYNQRLYEDDVALTIRIGRDSSDFIAQPVDEPTVFEPGAMVRLGGRVWEGTTPTLRANAGDNHPHIQIHNVEPSMAVRRLTPLECERLMGWPDDHTRYNADGTEQADTHRYKQCGNGVASPVAEWIGKQLMKLDEAAQ